MTSWIDHQKDGIDTNPEQQFISCLKSCLIIIKSQLIKMKRAISLLLLAVLITSLTLVDVHQGEYGHENFGHEQGESNEGFAELFQNKEIYKGRGEQRYEGQFIWFFLIFEHASRDGLWNQDSNRFAIQFNGRIIKNFFPRDFKIHKEVLKIKGRKGKNIIHFIGTGVSDSYGSQVDNIKLFYNNKNYIKNGGFEEGHHLGTGWLIFKNGEFKGWHCRDEMQVGWGRIYNSNWPQYTHVSELDANRNADIFQKFDVYKDGIFEKLEKYQKFEEIRQFEERKYPREEPYGGKEKYEKRETYPIDV